MRRTAFAVAVAFACTFSFAQTPPATQPGDVAELRAIIGILQKQIAALKAENAELKAKIAAMPIPPPAAPVIPVPADTFESRAVGGDAGAVTWGRMQDNRIADYLSKHDTTKEMAKAMYAGHYEIGMPEEAVRAMSNGGVQESSRTANTVTLRANVVSNREGDTGIKTLFFRNGLLDQISSD